MVFGVVALTWVSVMLVVVCDAYYERPELSFWTLGVYFTLPSAFYLLAPMSESLYLGLVLTMFWAATQQHWWLVGIAGSLATLTRFQGAVLPLTALFLLLEYRQVPLKFSAIRERWRELLPKALWFALIPLTFLGYTAIRHMLGLRPLSSIYQDDFYSFAADPISSLYYNLRLFVIRPVYAVLQIDPTMLVIVLLLGLVLLRSKALRTPAVLIYVFSHILLFITKVNYRFETNEIEYSQSVTRYSLALFPIWIMVADRVREGVRIYKWMVFVFLFLLVMLSASHALAGYLV